MAFEQFTKRMDPDVAWIIITLKDAKYAAKWLSMTYIAQGYG